MSADIQAAKCAVRNAAARIDADPNALREVVTDDYVWRGMHPFYEQRGADAVIETFWARLHDSFTAVQRREDMFFAGYNQHSQTDIWTCSHGTFMGVFDTSFAGIVPNHATVLIPYAEFHRVEGERIAESALFVDLVRLQQQAGLDPFPAQAGARMTPPGPRTCDGILLDACDPAMGEATRELLDRMVADITRFNGRRAEIPSLDDMRRTWHDDMSWYGPAGIGTTHTLPRYQADHQRPFRTSLSDKVFNGHVCRIAEGHYSGWFGWPNLNNRNTGHYLGLPPADVHAEMRVVDIYRRDGRRLAENWVLIDLLHYAAQHGVDLLQAPNALHAEAP